MNKIEVVSTEGRGDYEKECVILRANEACNLGTYMIWDGVGEIPRHPAFRFPNTEVKEGDLIRVFTAEGGPYRKEGINKHVFHWGEPKPVWGDTKLLPRIWENA